MESSLKRSLFVAKMLLSSGWYPQWRGKRQPHLHRGQYSGKDDIDTKDGIDTKDSSGRARLQYGGGVKRAVSIRSAVVERMVQEVA